MSHDYRFYIPSEHAHSGEVVLEKDEAHHALHVVRLREGDPALLFDGCGNELTGVVASVTRNDVRIRIENSQFHPKPEWSLTLALASLNRPKSMETLIRQCTEVGVDHFLFFQGAHSERAPTPNEKWKRLAVESCKQCGRHWLPSFSAAPDFESALAKAEGTLLIATQALPPAAPAQPSREVTAFIGPEGDFTSEEVERAIEKGARPVSLGPYTLRSELAATALAVLTLRDLASSSDG